MKHLKHPPTVRLRKDVRFFFFVMDIFLGQFGFGFTTQGGGFLVPSKVGSRWVKSRILSDRW